MDGRSGNATQTRIEGASTCAVDPASLSSNEGDRPRVGTSIGRYVVLEEVGRGGMGRVLRAYDPKLQREVAIKELRGHGLGPDGEARLVAEARAMAKLSHPNVVAVYDVEVLEHDRLVLVMEYVPGTTLRAWIRAERRSWQAIVQRFVEAGRGLHAAHAAGVLHRDFKPANVLVGDAGLVKVTDFGLAKSRPTVSSDGNISDSLTDGEGGLTQSGIVLGTPRYMAPEQHRSQELSPAADQYAFCVALWEALCDAGPFSGKTAEQLGELKLHGPPAWPNPSVPRRIAESVRRGLAPDPRQRWPSIETLLDVLAYDPTARRNKLVLGVGGALLILAGAQIWGGSGGARAERCSGADEQIAPAWGPERRHAVETAILHVQRPYAQRVWQNTASALDDYTEAWTSMHTEACEATVRGEQSAELLDLRMACLHRAKVELTAVTDVLSAATPAVVERAHQLVAGLRPPSRCADVEALQSEVEPPLPEEAEVVEDIRVVLAKAKARQEAGSYETARGLVEDARKRLEGVRYGPIRSEVAILEGRILDDVGEIEGSEAAFQEGLRSAVRWKQWDQMLLAVRGLMNAVGERQQKFDVAWQLLPLAEGLADNNPTGQAAIKNLIANVLESQGRYEEAEERQRQALALFEEELGPDSIDVSVTLNNLAGTLYAQGRYEDAAEVQRRALEICETRLGSDHPETAARRNNLATISFAQGDYREAEAQQRAALAVREGIFGTNHPEVADSWNNLSVTLHALGDEKQAEEAARRALELWEQALSADHKLIGMARVNLANAELALGELQAAESEYRRAIEVLEHALGPEHAYVLNARSALGSALHRQGKHEEGEAQERRVLASRQDVLGPEHPEVATSFSTLAIYLEQRGELAEAEQQQRRALALFEKSHGPDHPHVAAAHSHLATILLRAGRAQEARTHAQQAWVRQQQDDTRPPQRADTAFVLARALHATAESRRDRRQATDLAEASLKTFEHAGNLYASSAQEVHDWLQEHR